MALAVVVALGVGLVAALHGRMGQAFDRAGLCLLGVGRCASTPVTGAAAEPAIAATLAPAEPSPPPSTPAIAALDAASAFTQKNVEGAIEAWGDTVEALWRGVPMPLRLLLAPLAAPYLVLASQPGQEFLKGLVVTGLGGAVDGVLRIMADPIGAVKGLGLLAAALITRPGETVGAIWQKVKDFCTDNPARCAGAIVFEVVTAILPTKAGKAGQAGKLDELGDARHLVAAADPAPPRFPCQGGACRGACFVAGTPVATAAGARPIEQIAPGDEVWARDPEGGDAVLRPVRRSFVRAAREVVALALTTAAGATETLVVTPEHPFWVDGRGWVAAAGLSPGSDRVASRDGRRLAVAGARTLPELATVYNLEVEELHTYFAGALGALVHNECLLPRLALPELAPRQQVARNFDFDDNVMHMPTPVRLYDRATGQPLDLPTDEFAHVKDRIGQPGPYAGYELRDTSFARMRDDPGGAHPFFAEDLARAVKDGRFGPSWADFVRATSTEEGARATTIITARGHAPRSVHQGLTLLRDQGFIRHVPPEENLFPVTYYLGNKVKEVPAAKAEVMERLLDRLQQTPKGARPRPILDRDGGGRAALHAWHFSDDDYDNFAQAVRQLGDGVRAGRWPDVKITLFYTGKGHPEVKPHAVVLRSDGLPRPLDASEAAALERARQGPPSSQAPLFRPPGAEAWTDEALLYHLQKGPADEIDPAALVIARDKQRGFWSGTTPNKRTQVGQAVIARMQKETNPLGGPMLRNVDNPQGQPELHLWSPIRVRDDGFVESYTWIPVYTKDVHMGHKIPSSELAQRYGPAGPRNPELRRWMTDPDNYSLEYGPYNVAWGSRNERGPLADGTWSYPTSSPYQVELPGAGATRPADWDRYGAPPREHPHYEGLWGNERSKEIPAGTYDPRRIPVPGKPPVVLPPGKTRESYRNIPQTRPSDPTRPWDQAR